MPAYTLAQAIATTGRQPVNKRMAPVSSGAITPGDAATLIAT